MGHLLNIGVTPGMTTRETRRVRTLNFMIWIAIFTPLFWCIPGLVYDNRLVVGYNLFASIIFVCLLFMPVMTRIWLGCLFGTAFIAGHHWVILGPNVANYTWFIPLVGLLFLLVPQSQRKMAILLAIVELILFSLGEFEVSFMAPLAPFPSRVEWVASIVNTVSAAGVLVIIVAYFSRQSGRAEKALEFELDRSDQLLLNVLPASIADRLKSGEKELADHYPQVSVLFADLVGFTPLASTLSAPDLMRILSRLFSTYDNLTGALGLEKIKTIGDAYMVAAGVPEEREDHADAMAQLALGIRDATQAIANELDLDLSVRIGIHSGDVVGGVIGQSKFTFDLWGDTVNIASRMEHHGDPGRIQISAATHKLLTNRFRCEARGDLEVKGRGSMKTYWLLGQAVQPG